MIALGLVWRTAATHPLEDVTNAWQRNAKQKSNFDTGIVIFEHGMQTTDIQLREMVKANHP